MKEIIITKDESGQRIDRYLRKIFKNASLSFIYKQIRKKNIVVNDSKVNEKYILNDGDSLKLYFSDETIEKFKSDEKEVKKGLDLDIIYEDDNILIINKPAGVLTHSASSNEKYYEDNIVDSMIAYLVNKGEFRFKKGQSFTPSVANRLDRNTSGLLIGAKNYTAIKEINKAQRLDNIEKYYYTIVKGYIKNGAHEEAELSKLENKKNQVRINTSNENSKKIITEYKPIISGKNYSLLEINLITGRTHQIRSHLSYLNMPIIGDRKYGDNKINKYFREKYKINNQVLHCYKLVFKNLNGELSYLNNRIFETDIPYNMKKIIDGEINE